VAEPDERERWEMPAVAPFLVMRTPNGKVGVTSLGRDRYKLTGPGHEEELVGFDAAREAAHALARSAQPHSPSQ